MNPKFTVAIALTAFAFSPVRSWAAPSGAGAVLKLGAGSKAPAMSDAFTAGSGDPSAMFYNPAALAAEKGTSAMLTHAIWFESVNYTVAALSRYTEKYGALGFGIRLLNYGEIDSLDSAGISDGSFSPRDVAVSAGWGRGLNSGWLDGSWSVGAQVKYLSSKISESASALLADGGVQYKRSRLAAGFSLQNIGTSLKYGSESESVPVQTRFGLAYAWRTITAYGDLGIPSDAKMWAALGAEYFAYSTDKLSAALRAGYSTRAGDARNDKIFPLSFGLGIGMSEFGLDYAFVPYGDLGQTHHITLNYRWARTEP